MLWPELLKLFKMYGKTSSFQWCHGYLYAPSFPILIVINKETETQKWKEHLAEMRDVCSHRMWQAVLNSLLMSALRIRTGREKCASGCCRVQEHARGPRLAHPELPIKGEGKGISSKSNCHRRVTTASKAFSHEN